MNVRWRLTRPAARALAAGAATGVLGALLFATAHAIIIVPTWGRMWSGLVTGPLAGAAAGWALIEVIPAVVVAGAASAAALGARFGAALWLLVTPVTILDAVLRHYGISDGTDVLEITVALTVAAVSGGLFAWSRTRRWRSTIAGALATVTLTLAMAGPVPIARSTRAMGIFVAVLPVAALSGIVLAFAVRRIRRVERAEG